MRRRLLDTPESGVLGRVALANRLTRAVFAFTALFAILIGNLTYVQVIKAKDYQDMPTNNHTIARSKYIQRGSIITSDGVTLAESLQQEDGTYARSYPNGNMAAHVVGYVSQQYGTAGIESVMNDTLTGSKDYSSWNNAIVSLAGQTQPGNTAKLTIDSRIQTAAEQALKGFKGAVVVIDPRTGAVLACASSPTYDNTNIDALMQSGGGEDGSMYDRAMDALYTPGSTFKVVTLSAALETGTASLTSTYQAPGSMDIGNAPVTNSANESYGTISLQQAFAVSSNVVFGQVANEVGANTLVQFANAFGYGQKLGQDLTTAASIMADPSLMTEWETAWAGAGQPVGMDHTPGPQTTVMQNRRDRRRYRQQRRGHGPVLCSPRYSPRTEPWSRPRSPARWARLSALPRPTRSSRPCSPSSSPVPAPMPRFRASRLPARPARPRPAAPTSTRCSLALHLTIHPRLPSRWPWRITTNTTSRPPRSPASS